MIRLFSRLPGGFSALRLIRFFGGCVSGVVLLLGMSSRIVLPPSLIGASFCCALSSVGATELPDEPKRSYNLPRGDAAKTLRKFARISRTQVLFMMDKVRGEQTNAIDGEYSPREALELMLADTALVLSQDDTNKGFVVSRRRLPEPHAEVGTDANPQSQRKEMKRSTPIAWLMALFGAAAAPNAPAQAVQTGQQAAVSEEEDEPIELEAFAVTGTQIRGIEPVGTNVVGLSREGIIETGSLDTNQLLA